MNKKEKYLFAITIVVVFIVFMLVWTGQAANNSGTTEQNQEVQMIIIAHDEELVNEAVRVASDTTLLDIMQQNYNLVVREDGFIESIEGVDENPEDGLYWIYEANEQMVNEGAAEFIPQDNDIITWELISF